LRKAKALFDFEFHIHAAGVKTRMRYHLGIDRGTAQTMAMLADGFGVSVEQNPTHLPPGFRKRDG